MGDLQKSLYFVGSIIMLDIVILHFSYLIHIVNRVFYNGTLTILETFFCHVALFVIIRELAFRILYIFNASVSRNSIVKAETID